MTVVLSVAIPTGIASADDSLPSFLTVSYPAGLNASEKVLYRGLFGDQGRWAPRGRVVANSGFRPPPDGFSFLNYGESLYLNQLFFAQPSALGPDRKVARRTRLLPRDMRVIFGDRVCVQGTALTKNSNCTLTESAEQMRIESYGWGKAGSCYGLTNLSAGLFNQYISPAVIAGGKTNTLTALSKKVQRAIARLVVVGHLGARAVPYMSVTQTLEELQKSLTPNTIPYLLLLYGAPGGHAVVPYAILERSSGVFDIAVYDPNFPNQPRAVHVDTNTGQWEYEGSAIPSQTSLMWDSTDTKNETRMYLGLIEQNFQLQACPFCVGPPGGPVGGALVTFSPIRAINAAFFDSLRLLDVTGNPLNPSLYTINKPLDLTGGDWVNGPTISVDPGVVFTIDVNGAGIKENQELTITTYRQGDVSSVLINALAPTLSGSIRLNADAPRLYVALSSLESLSANQTAETDDASYLFSISQRSRGANAVLDLSVRPKLLRTVIQGNRNSDIVVTLKMRSRNATGTSVYRANRIRIPAEARVITSYANWTGSSGSPRAWIDADSDGTPDTRIVLTRTR